MFADFRVSGLFYQDMVYFNAIMLSTSIYIYRKSKGVVPVVTLYMPPWA